MNVEDIAATIIKLGRAEKWLRVTIAAALISFIAFVVSVAPMLAEVATQISGIAYFAEPGECMDEAGQGADFALNMTADLHGCLYVFVQTAECTLSGDYHETGTEIYVGGEGPTVRSERPTASRQSTRIALT